MKKALISLFMTAACVSVFAANPVTVSATGDFNSIQDAIDSFVVGGANAGETAPFIIQVDPSVERDESIHLSATTWGAELAGDLVIESATPGTLVPFAMQLTSDQDDGCWFLTTQSVKFKDFLMYPSQTNVFTDEFFRVDAPGACTNTLAFENCVITEIDGSGDPLVTSKATAIAAPQPATVGSTRSGYAYIIQVWPDAGENVSVTFDNCAVFGNIQQSAIRLAGTSGAFVSDVNINDSYIAFAGDYLIRATADNYNYNITGTDVSAGPASATVFRGAANHLVYFAGGITGNISNTMFLALGAECGATTRCLSAGAATDLTLTDCMFYSEINAPAIVDAQAADAVFSDCSFFCTQSNALFNVNSTGSLTIKDSVFAGPGSTALAGAAPDGGLSVENCGFAMSGDYALAASDDAAIVIAYSNKIEADPEFDSVSPGDASFLDVSSASYAAQGSGGSDLDGAANFTGNAPVQGWELY